MRRWWQARLRSCVRSRRGVRGDRGAIVPMVAILLPVIVIVASLAVDVGQQRVGRSDMQALADVVSLDMVRLLDGRSAGVLTADPSWDASRVASVSRNTGTFGSTPTVVVEPGTYVSATGVFTPVTGSSVPTAVRVTATTKVDFSFQPGHVGYATRTAIAVPKKSACFQLGSYAAAVNTGDATLLNGLLAQIAPGFDLGAAGYTGLLNANVALLDVAAQLGVGSVSQLAGTTVSAHDFYVAIANVLANNGDTTDAQVLKNLAANVSSAGSVNLGSLISASTGGGVNAAINVIDLIAGSAFLLSGNHLLSIPGIAATLPGLGSVTSSLSLIEGKILGCLGDVPDPTTSQLGATVTGTVPATVVPVAGLGNVTVGTPTGKAVTTTVSLASSTGKMTDATCTSALSTKASESVQVTNGLFNVSTSIPLVITGQISLAGIVGLVNVSIGLTVTVAKNSAPTISNVTITVPPQKYATAYSSGTGNLALSTSDLVNTTGTVTATLVAGLAAVTISPAALNTIINTVDSTIVTPLINQLNAGPITMLTTLLGARLGGADVFALSHPLCTNPSLAQ